MLERTIKESWTLEDIQELQMKLARLKGDTRPFYEQCKAVSYPPPTFIMAHLNHPEPRGTFRTDNSYSGLSKPISRGPLMTLVVKRVKRRYHLVEVNMAIALTSMEPWAA